jgi:hypothetical protein
LVALAADALVAAFLRVRLAGAGVSDPAAAASEADGVDAVDGDDGAVDGAALGALEPLDGLVVGVGGPAGRLAERRRRVAGFAAPLGLSFAASDPEELELLSLLGVSLGSSSSTRSPRPLPGAPVRGAPHRSEVVAVHHRW